MRDELESHIDAHVADLVRAGIEPAEARRRALLALGGLQATATLCAESRSSFLSALAWDVVTACRGLRQHLRFSGSVAAVVTLAVAAVAIVAAVTQAVLIGPLPYPEADRLAITWQHDHAADVVVEVSYRDYVDWRARQTAFTDLAAMGSTNWTERLTGLGNPIDVPAAAVSASFFSVLGTQPLFGRVLGEEDDVPNAPPVAVVSYGFWQRHLGGDPGALGRSVRFDGRLREVVGIMPRGFDFPRAADMWIPLVPTLHAVSTADLDALENRGLAVLFVIGRLRVDVPLDVAQTQLTSIHRQLPRQAGEGAVPTVILTRLEERLVGRTADALRLLGVAVGLLMLIASANVAMLLLQRASRSQRDTAIRMAMGASVMRLTGLWLIEMVVLFSIGATAGLAVATWLLPAVIRLAPDSIYRIDETRLTATVVAVSLLIAWSGAFAAACLVSRATLRGWRVPRALKEATQITSTRSATRTRRALVCAELILAFVLLIGAGLTLRSFERLRQLDLGFDHTDVLTFDVSPPSGTFEGKAIPANRAFYTPLVTRLAEMPQVEAVGAINLRPLEFEAIGNDSAALTDAAFGVERAWQTRAVTVNWQVATPGYFRTMRVPLRAGRYFADGDDANAPLVALLSESAATRLFHGTSAIGRRVVISAERRRPDGQRPWRTVVGVVADVRYRGLQDPRLDYYVPATQSVDSEVKHVVVRTARPQAVVTFVRQIARDLHPDAVVDHVRTMTSIVDRAAAPWRLYMVLFVILGLMAASMAGIGVFLITQSSVSERRYELGVRAALGSTQGQSIRLVMSEGLLLLAISLVVGWSIATVSVGFMQSVLFETPARDGATFASVAVGLTVLALIANYLPARAAGRVSPAVLLKSA